MQLIDARIDDPDPHARPGLAFATGNACPARSRVHQIERPVRQH